MTCYACKHQFNEREAYTKPSSYDKNTTWVFCPRCKTLLEWNTKDIDVETTPPPSGNRDGIIVD